MTRAPAATARISVSSVDPESSTISSSTSPPSSGVMVSTTLPTVCSSLSAGSTTEMVRPAFAAVSSSTVHDGRLKLWSVNQRCRSAPSMPGSAVITGRTVMPVP
jgi:hypothetical protein